MDHIDLLMGPDKFMRIALLKPLLLVLLLALTVGSAISAWAQAPFVLYLLDDSPAISPPNPPAPLWGRLANPGFFNQPIKATLFFPGQALDGTNKYSCAPTPGNNISAYTMHPLIGTHLKWSENSPNRDAAVVKMVQAGINVVNMSSWGEDFLPCAWVTGAAPMQTSPLAHDELFTAVAGKHLLITPFIESRGGELAWSFRGEFPRRGDGLVAPGTTSQIVNLVNRYLKNPTHPEWAEKWARVYDQTGEDRYAVVIIHGSSDLLATNDDTVFAAGFDLIADEVYRQTGKKVGFFIDALPRETNAPGRFRPSPESTGPQLWRVRSVLGIECFIPEIWIGSSDTDAVINWKREFSRRWHATGVPFVMDVSPGYDGHVIFGQGAPHYGITAEWTRQLSDMVRNYGVNGTVFNAWNGYTEALVAVPTKEHDSQFYNWLKSLP